MVTVADIMNVMHQMAPGHLAESWDNVGLQFGDVNWPVKSVFIALEPTTAAVKAACDAGADMLITHHPLIFKPLKTINVASPTGGIIHLAARHQLAIFAAHTNLDSAIDGINDMLADRIGITNRSVLCKAPGAAFFKLVFFVPSDHAESVLDAIYNTPAGRIGDYTCCTFRNNGLGTFLADASAQPFKGAPGEFSETAEVRIETRVEKAHLNSVISKVKAHHPYQTMAYDIYPLETPPAMAGIGRIGTLDKPRGLSELAADIKSQMQLPSIRYSGPGDMNIVKAAVCSGSGGGVLTEFLASDAQVLISGDLKYHDAVSVAEADRALIDMGHFASEHLIVPVIKQRIEQAGRGWGDRIEVTAWGDETDPFHYF